MMSKLDFFKISKRKSQFLDDLLPGFNSLGAQKGIYSSERNDVEKQTTAKTKKGIIPVNM